LLHTGLGAHDTLTEPQLRGLGVAPFGPRRKARDFVAALLQDLLPVDTIESVFEINFEHDLVWVPGIPLTPLPGSLDARFGAKRQRHPYLERVEVEKSSAWRLLAQAFGDESSPCFANSDGPDVAVFF
jgi:hypothetical protein